MNPGGAESVGLAVRSFHTPSFPQFGPKMKHEGLLADSLPGTGLVSYSLFCSAILALEHITPNAAP